MSGHTPGPWRVSCETQVFSDSAGRIICQPYLDVANGPVIRKHVQIANAKLIAAAPDLLASLEYLMAIIAPQGDERYLTITLTPEYFDEARKAIARAKGEA